MIEAAFVLLVGPATIRSRRGHSAGRVAWPATSVCRAAGRRSRMAGRTTRPTNSGPKNDGDR